MVSYEIDRLESFARSLVEEYEDSTKLDSISDLDDYSEIEHRNREFVQIGKRSNLPKRFFHDESTVTEPLVNQFVDSITIGEVVSVLSSIEDGVDDNEVGSFEISDFSYESLIVESFSHVYDPDMIYIPNDKDFRKELLDWRHEGRIKSKQDGLYIAGASDIKVNWMPSKWGIENILVFNSNDIHVVQKQFADADFPEYIEPVNGFDAAENDDRLMLYIGKEFKDNPDEYELFIRSIISKPRFTGYMPHSACVVELSSELEL
jgi:hypothetical protein